MDKSSSCQDEVVDPQAWGREDKAPCLHVLLALDGHVLTHLSQGRNAGTFDKGPAGIGVSVKLRFDT